VRRCVIVGGDEGSWGQGVHSKRWRGIGVGAVILAHLHFFLVGVIEDDDIAITRRPKKSMVEVTKELSGNLLIPSSVREGILLPSREIHHREPLGGLAMLIHWGWQPSGRDLR
jgi:hypothetical protein